MPESITTNVRHKDTLWHIHVPKLHSILLTRIQSIATKEKEERCLRVHLLRCYSACIFISLSIPLSLSSFWGVSTEQRTHSPTFFLSFLFHTTLLQKNTSIIANVKGPMGIEPTLLYTVERSDQIARMRERREKQRSCASSTIGIHICRTEFLSQGFKPGRNYDGDGIEFRCGNGVREIKENGASEECPNWQACRR